MLGAIIGDIVGSTREWHNVKTEDFELLPQGSRFTDDTVMTLAVAKWLMDDPSHEADSLVREGDVISLGETILRVLDTPGHTEGGICYVTDNEVFTGDTLFRLSVGNTSLETGSWPTMVDSIKSKLYTLDDVMIVYPGHGPATQIGYEKRSNPFV